MRQPLTIGLPIALGVTLALACGAPQAPEEPRAGAALPSVSATATATAPPTSPAAAGGTPPATSGSISTSSAATTPPAGSSAAGAQTAAPTTSATAVATSVPEVLRQVAATRADLATLAKAKTDEERAAEVEKKFRLIRFGISVGVAASVYTPGFFGNTLDGVAGGVMPYVGFFPGYWGSQDAKNVYCALEWSTSEKAALGNARRVNGGDGSESRKRLDEAQKAADASATTQEEAARLLEIASRVETTTQQRVNTAAQAAQKPAPSQAEKEELTAALSALALAQADREKAVAAAQAAQEDAAKKLETLKAEAKKVADEEDGVDQVLASELLAHRDDERDELIDKLQEIISHRAAITDRPEALVGAALSFLSAGATADDLPACESSMARSASIRLAKKGTGAEIANITCRIALISRDLVALRRQADGFQGTSTNCFARKFGGYVGYPAMFNADTVIDARTPVNRVEREVTPVASAGFLAAPNALIAFTLGPWFGMAEVTPDDSEFVWGATVGIGVTNDVLSALAD